MVRTSNMINLRNEKSFPKMKLDQLIKSAIKNSTLLDKIAVFDFDNTMILGDIGDASIAFMLENEIDVGFSWSEYLELQRIGDVQKAFRMASNIFNGFEVDCIKRFANAVVKIENPDIVFFENDYIFKVKVPRPNSVMIDLVKLLYKFDFEIHIISSSNQFLVSQLAKKYFDLDSNFVHGIKHEIQRFMDVDVLTETIISPTPIDTGKIDVYKKYIGKSGPILFGGDSIYDLPISKTVAQNGIIFWFGDQSIIEKCADEKLSIVLI